MDSLFVSIIPDRGEVVPSSATAMASLVSSRSSVSVGGGSALAGGVGNVRAAAVAAAKIVTPATVLRWWRTGELEERALTVRRRRRRWRLGGS